MRREYLGLPFVATHVTRTRAGGTAHVRSHLCSCVGVAQPGLGSKAQELDNRLLHRGACCVCVLISCKQQSSFGSGGYERVGPYALSVCVRCTGIVRVHYGNAIMVPVMGF